MHQNVKRIDIIMWMYRHMYNDTPCQHTVKTDWCRQHILPLFFTISRMEIEFCYMVLLNIFSSYYHWVHGHNGPHPRLCRPAWCPLAFGIQDFLVSVMFFVVSVLAVKSCCDVIALQDARYSGPGIILCALSQWETTLQCNVVSHWLGACTNWSLSRLLVPTVPGWQHPSIHPSAHLSIHPSIHTCTYIHWSHNK